RAVTGATAIFYNRPGSNKASNIYSGDPAYNDFTQNQGRIGYEFEHRFNEVVTVRQNLRFNAVDADMEYSRLVSPTTRYWSHYKEDMKNFVIDNMAQFEFDTGPMSHTTVAGVDYAWSDYNAYGDPNTFFSVISADDIASRPVPFYGSQEMNQLGVYLHDQMEWNNFTLFASGRYDWVDTTSLDASRIETEQKDDAFSGRIGISYRTEWGIIPYVNYSTSFSPNIGFVEDASGTHPARPTIAKQKEIGVKYEIPNTNAVISAAFFDIDQEDGNVFDASGSGQQIQRQYDMNSRGFELEANASFDNGFSFIASYTNLRVKIEEGPTGTIGKELSATPNHIFNLWGHYVFQEGLLEGLGIGAGVRFASESFGNDQNSFKNSARTYVDAAISYDFGARNPKLKGLMAQVNAKNLFDEREQVCSAGYCYRDEGVAVFGSLRYRF
ncbi:MAG TPA: TonB-dependent receptor, partial [Rhizobiaceae bacterium]|nr:TonB-dependent receptor [Rhizobiaceae bacterium]